MRKVFLRAEELDDGPEIARERKQDKACNYWKFCECSVLKQKGCSRQNKKGKNVENNIFNRQRKLSIPARRIKGHEMDGKTLDHTSWKRPEGWDGN